MYQYLPQLGKKVKVGSREWIEAHRTKNGGWRITPKDMELLMSTREWQEGFKRFKREVLKMYAKMKQRERSIQ